MAQPHEVQMLVFLDNRGKVITHIWFEDGEEVKTRQEIIQVVDLYLNSLPAEKQFEVGSWDLIDVVKDCYIDRASIVGALN